MSNNELCRLFITTVHQAHIAHFLRTVYSSTGLSMQTTVCLMFLVPTCMAPSCDLCVEHGENELFRSAHSGQSIQDLDGLISLHRYQTNEHLVKARCWGRAKWIICRDNNKLCGGPLVIVLVADRWRKPDWLNPSSSMFVLWLLSAHNINKTNADHWLGQSTQLVQSDFKNIVVWVPSINEIMCKTVKLIGFSRSNAYQNYFIPPWSAYLTLDLAIISLDSGH